MTETVTLNLDGTFPAEATKGATAAERLTASLDKLTNALEHSGNGLKKHAEHGAEAHKDLEILRHAYDGIKEGLGGMASALKAGDPKAAIEGATNALAGLASTLDLVAPGLGQAASALVKLGGAFVGVTAEIIEAGVELAVEARSTNAAIEATFDALGKGPGAGAAAVKMLDDLSDRLPQSRKRLEEWARTAAAGETDIEKIKNEVLATASAQGLLGERGVAAYEKINKGIHDAIEGEHTLKLGRRQLMDIGPTVLADAATRMGTTLPKLEAALKGGLDPKKVDAFGTALENALIAKGGKGLDAMWMKTSVTTDKLKEKFVKLFDEVDTGPLTEGLRDVLGLLDNGQPSADALKGHITSAFNEIIKDIGSAIEEGEYWFLSMEVWALSMELNLRPVWRIIKEIAGALGTIGQGLGLGPTPTVPGAPPKTVEQNQADAALSTFKWLGGPANFVGVGIAQGLINGMQSKFAEVVATGDRLGEGAITGTKTGAGTHSPSVPAMKVGGFVSRGLELGMLNDIGLPARAGRQIGGAAIGGMVGAAIVGAPAANGNGGGLTITIQNLNVTGREGVTDATALSASGLAVVLERYQLASGR